jgi:hypothetical protein
LLCVVQLTALLMTLQNKSLVLDQHVQNLFTRIDFNGFYSQTLLAAAINNAPALSAAAAPAPAPAAAASTPRSSAGYNYSAAAAPSAGAAASKPYALSASSF